MNQPAIPTKLLPYVVTIQQRAGTEKPDQVTCSISIFGFTRTQIAYMLANCTKWEIAGGKPVHYNTWLLGQFDADYITYGLCEDVSLANTVSAIQALLVAITETCEGQERLFATIEALSRVPEARA